MKLQKKHIYLFISIISMCLYGYGFILTVYNKSLEEALNCTPKETSLVFTVCLVMFNLGILACGYIYRFLKLRTMFAVSTIMIGLGIFLSARVDSVEALYFTIGALYGFGAGIGYKAHLTSMVAWFPNNVGVISGMLFMGTGLTAMVFNVPINSWIEGYGWRNSFIILACITTAILIINALVVKQYPMDPFKKNDNKDNVDAEITGIPTGHMIKTARFWTFFIWCVLLSSISMSIASNSVATALSIGVSSSIAAFYSGLISLFNSGSRILYGLLYDKKGWRISMSTATVFAIFSVLIVLLALKQGNSGILVVGYILLGFCFGAVHPISSAYTLNIFGKKYYSQNYGVQGLFSLISTFTGPLLLGNLNARFESFYDTYMYLLIYGLVAIASYIVLRLIHKGHQQLKTRTVLK
jgi:OFA family oxalate/formate antiporter-like MFS transporter